MTSYWKDITMAKWLRRLGRAAGLAIVVLLLAAPLGVVQAALIWQPETVDSEGDVGEYTSLALDSDGHPHISYYDDTNADLKYAAFDGTSWQIETVDAFDAFGRVGEYSSLALDSNGHPHISYHDANNHSLKYAVFDGAEWDVSTVDDETFSGQGSSLVLDSNDQPRISYITLGSFPNASLKYAVLDGTSWEIEVVPTGGTPSRSISLALIGPDWPVICYAENVSGALACAFLLPDTGWQIETANLGEGRAVDISLAVAGNQQLHISFLDGNTGHLMHAIFNGTDWQIQTVDASGHSIHRPSLTLDDGDRPHISYYDLTNGDLKYAHLVVNEPPVVEAGGSYSGAEGSPISLDATVSDSDEDELATTWSYTVNSADPGTTCTFGDASKVDTTFACTDDGTFTVTLTTHDGFTSPVTDTATVTISNVDPTVTLGDDVEIFTGDTYTGTGSFSDPGANDSHSANAYYGDGSGEQALTLNADGSFDLSHTYQTAGSYLLSVCVADDDEVAGGCDTLMVDVVNAPITVDVGGPYTGTEGNGVTLDASVANGDPNDSFTFWFYEVDSTDSGTTCTFFDLFQVENNTFTCTDDGAFTISLTYMDPITSPITANATVTISNVAPTVTLSADTEITLGDTFSDSGSFSDPGVNDTHTATIDYGDGSGVQALSLNDDGSFTLSHSYTSAGQFTPVHRGGLCHRR